VWVAASEFLVYDGLMPWIAALFDTFGHGFQRLAAMEDSESLAKLCEWAV
jgi:hypothetical protein